MRVVKDCIQMFLLDPMCSDRIYFRWFRKNVIEKANATDFCESPTFYISKYISENPFGPLDGVFWKKSPMPSLKIILI